MRLIRIPDDADRHTLGQAITELQARIHGEDDPVVLAELEADQDECLGMWREAGA